MRARAWWAAAALTAAVAGSAQAQTPLAAPPSALRMMSATFAVTDLDRSIAFYTKGLGLTAARVIENKSNTEVPLLFPDGGMSLLLIKWNAEAASPRHGRVILDVPDLRALEAKLTAAGYRLRGPIVDQTQHKVLVAVVEDPDGNELELVQRPH